MPRALDGRQNETERCTSVVKVCRVPRRFAHSPDLFNQKLEGLLFAIEADADIVRGFYENAYDAVANLSSQIDLADCNLIDSLEDMEEMLTSCKDGLRSLSLADNVNLTGNLFPLGRLGKLTSLDLRCCQSLEGNLQPLRGLRQLKELHLSYCLKLTGDFRPLWAPE